MVPFASHAQSSMVEPKGEIGMHIEGTSDNAERLQS